MNTKFPLRRRDVSTQTDAESTMPERQAVSQSGKYVRRPTRAAPTTLRVRVPVIRAFSRPAAIHSLAQSLPCLRAAPFFASRGRPRGARRGPGAPSDRSPVLLIASLAANFKLSGGGGGAGQFCSYPSAAGRRSIQMTGSVGGLGRFPRAGPVARPARRRRRTVLTCPRRRPSTSAKQ